MEKNYNGNILKPLFDLPNSHPVLIDILNSIFTTEYYDSQMVQTVFTFDDFIILANVDRKQIYKYNATRNTFNKLNSYILSGGSNQTGGAAIAAATTGIQPIINYQDKTT